MQATVAVLGILRFPPERMPEVWPHLKALVDATYRTDGTNGVSIAIVL